MDKDQRLQAEFHAANDAAINLATVVSMAAERKANADSVKKIRDAQALIEQHRVDVQAAIANAK